MPFIEKSASNTIEPDIMLPRLRANMLTNWGIMLRVTCLSTRSFSPIPWALPTAMKNSSEIWRVMLRMTMK